MMNILVTGGNRSLGYAMVQLLGTRLPSSTILIGCRDVKSGEEAITSMRSAGVLAKLDVVQLDIEDDASIAQAAADIKAKYTKLDVLVSNAARVQQPTSGSDVRSAANTTYNSVITSNQVLADAFLPLLRLSSNPRVIMVSSSRGSLGRTASKQLPPVAAVSYCVAKAGLNMLLLHLQSAQDVADHSPKVKFWAACPGHCKTAFNAYKGAKDPLEGAEVVARLVQADDGVYESGTFWEFKDEMHQVEW